RPNISPPGLEPSWATGTRPCRGRRESSSAVIVSRAIEDDNLRDVRQRRFLRTSRSMGSGVESFDFLLLHSSAFPIKECKISAFSRTFSQASARVCKPEGDAVNCYPAMEFGIFRRGGIQVAPQATV